MSTHVRSRGGATQVQTQRKQKCDGCRCLRDPETGLACATDRCGCKKKNAESGGYCGEDCWCHKPLCECGPGDKGAVKRTVTKKGPNTGRAFFCCRLPMGKQCSYFQWAEPPLRNGKRLGNSASAASSSSSSSALSSSSASAAREIKEPIQKVISLLDSSSDEEEAVAAVAEKDEDPDSDVIVLDTKPYANINAEQNEIKEQENRDQNVFVSPCANQFNSRGALPIKPKQKPKPAKKGVSVGGAIAQGRHGGGRKKERCSAGRNCRFKHEYQHGLEFFHSDDEEGPDRRSGDKRAKIFVPFGGTGMKLGGGGV